MRRRGGLLTVYTVPSCVPAVMFRSTGKQLHCPVAAAGADLHRQRTQLWLISSLESAKTATWSSFTSRTLLDNIQCTSRHVFAAD